VRDEIDRKTFLKEIGGVFGWDEPQIDVILVEKDSEDSAQVMRVIGALPGREGLPQGEQQQL
jgi:hypothetical protein